MKEGGKWKRFNAAYDEHGHILANVVVMHGEQVEFPVCHYELRYTDDGVDHRPAVGDVAAGAEEQRVIVAAQLAVKKASEEVGATTTKQNDSAKPRVESSCPTQLVDPTLTSAGNAKRLTQAEALAEFVEDRELQDKVVMARETSRAWVEFVQVSGIHFIDQIDRKSLLKFSKAMRDRGLSDRTVCGNYQNVLAVLRFTGLDPQKLKFPPPPKYELKLPTVYTSVQLKRLFAEANEYERMAFQILLKLGLREQELMYAEFSDIDFEAKVFRVQGKEQYDFKVKDHEQREIPMPDDLVEALKIWKERHPGQSLILLTANDIPDGDLCHRVKMLAKRAGLECGTCKTCRNIAAMRAHGEDMRQVRGNGCKQFNLHKFRRTYITGLLLAGVDVRTRTSTKVAGAAGFAHHGDGSSPPASKRVPRSADRHLAIASALFFLHPQPQERIDR